MESNIKNNKKNKKVVGIIVNTLRGDPNIIVKNIKKILKKYNVKDIVIDYDISTYLNIVKAIKQLKDVLILGPANSLIYRMHDIYRKRILIKFTNSKTLYPVLFKLNDFYKSTHSKLRSKNN